MIESESKKIQSFRDLLVWQKGVHLVVHVYQLSMKLPKSETYGLMSQMQRAAVSIPANIAEGHARRHTGDFIHHLSIAIGSVAELETHLEIAMRLGFLSSAETQEAQSQCSEIARMLFGLIQKLRQRKS
jgi:four helix bundle protein